MYDIDSVTRDLASFADDDEEIVLDAHGSCILVRGGQEHQITIQKNTDDQLVVLADDEEIPYRRYLSHRLAQLPVLAERILAKRMEVPSYVDSRAALVGPLDSAADASAHDLLEHEAKEAPGFLSRVVFITADAGQGKTALLRHFQRSQAERFLEGRAPYLFWHVDLQGRQLVRLHEALMGDLGDLRVSGLWMPSIITLLRRRLLVLAIDGFDELAAEQGSGDALGALAVLVQQMQGDGTIVAASRRTFFDTDDYMSRSRLFRTAGASDCEFNEIRLQPWSSEQVSTYLASVKIDGRGFSDPEQTHREMRAELQPNDHPMLTRPFLVAKIAQGLLRYDMDPKDFLRGVSDPLKGVGEVIHAFVAREVAEKWKQPETGEPFLSEHQHLRLLADVAEEMFRAQRATIEVDVLEAIATLLFDEWKIDPLRRQQILQMVGMHVLLTPPAGTEYSLRAFDHDEFRDWFTAYALRDRLQQVDASGSQVLKDLLTVAQLPDATARYVCALIDKSAESVTGIVSGLSRLVRDEWRQTYLQGNCGTLVPFLLDDVVPDAPIVVDGEFVYSSVVHEGKRLQNVELRHGAFVNASLCGVGWRNVRLVDCDLGDITVDRRGVFQNVTCVGCRVDGVRTVGDDGEEAREYAPARMQSALERRGIRWEEPQQETATPGQTVQDGPTRKSVRRVLNIFRRTTLLSDSVVEMKFRSDARKVIEDVLPMMVSHGLLEVRQWKGSGRHDAWGLASTLEEIERADGDGGHQLSRFWQEVDQLDASGK